MRLLLVEDDALLGDGIAEGLTDAGFVVDWLKDGESARLALMTEHSFDGVVLDIGLPRMDGLQLLAWIRRERGHLPVLLLTARDSIEDRIKGLDAGADDYLIKPFALGELCARVRALVRRGKGKHDGELCWQDLVLDPAHQSVRQADQMLNLTAMEYRLLHLLMANHPHYLSRPQLEEKLYGWQQDIESNTLDVHLSHLRKKLHNVVIRNARNLGWRLEEKE
ncbi:MAG: response regulator [Proteobacteria bacterium]|nr:response regulator [Pseudomonadota bacterium]